MCYSTATIHYKMRWCRPGQYQFLTTTYRTSVQKLNVERTVDEHSQHSQFSQDDEDSVEQHRYASKHRHSGWRTDWAFICVPPLAEVSNLKNHSSRETSTTRRLGSLESRWIATNWRLRAFGSWPANSATEWEICPRIGVCVVFFDSTSTAGDDSNPIL